MLEIIARYKKGYFFYFELFLFTCSRLRLETLEQCMKHVKIQRLVLVFLLLILNM